MKLACTMNQEDHLGSFSCQCLGQAQALGTSESLWVGPGQACLVARVMQPKLKVIAEKHRCETRDSLQTAEAGFSPVEKFGGEHRVNSA